jgi:outer membrane protein assembly factor BamB
MKYASGALVLLLAGTAMTAACGRERGARDADSSACVCAFRASGFQRPASVLYDSVRDRYLVSNANGARDGFVAVLATDGTIASERWIEGGKKGVTLDDPKGLGIAGGILYVADVRVVRTFDAATGAPLSDVAIEGSTFLNDIAVSDEGKVYVSDCAVMETPRGYEPTGTDAVYVIEDGTPRVFAKRPELRQPSGLAVGPDGVWVVDGDGHLYRLDEHGAQRDLAKLPGATLDGLVMFGGRVFISDWDTSAVYAGPPSGPFARVVSGVRAPGDLGFDTKRSRLLVPRIHDNVVEAYDLPRTL